MTYFDHPFLKAFAAQCRPPYAVEELVANLARQGIERVAEDDQLAACEAALRLANATMQDLPDWMEDGPQISELTEAKIRQIHGELAHENGLLGAIGGALRDGWDGVYLFRSGSDLFAVQEDEEAWRGYAFLTSASGFREFFEASHKNTVGKITSTMIDGLALHNGPVEKPELAIELNRLVPLFPAPKSLSVEYAFLHGLPDPLRADLFAGLSLCVEIDHFFGRVPGRKAS